MLALLRRWAPTCQRSVSSDKQEADMSSWASIHLGKYPLHEFQNNYYEWFFQPSERRIERGDIRNLHSNLTPIVGESECASRYVYVSSVRTLRKRLELAGFDKAKLEREFKIRKKSYLAELSKGFELRRELAEKYLPIVEAASLDDWIAALKISVSGATHSREGEERFPVFGSFYDYGDPLVSFINNHLFEFDDEHATIHGTNFPCSSLECYAVAIMSFMNEDEECVLDITELVDAGRTDGFKDLAEFNRGYTDIFWVHQGNLTDVNMLLEVQPDSQTLIRVLYASAITTMEAYLSDIFKREVLRRESMKRRFVASHPDFKEKIALSSIFDAMESLDDRIEKVIDETSFHNIDSTCAMFKQVLGASFPPELMQGLKAAVEIRHDIVHRHGKTKKGMEIRITKEQFEDVCNLTNSLVVSIDKQIKDNLLDPVVSDLT
ncbi:HEPN/Toprim-associated domain-containing protein [Burkholderia pyrrocinia]